MTTLTTDQRWLEICALDDLDVNRGVAALVDDDQVALFRVTTPGPDGDEQLLAIANRDPFSGANVLARGIVGSVGDHVVVASPMFKQHFDLHDGRCLDDDSVRLRVWPVRAEQGRVQILVDDFGGPGLGG